MKRTTKKIVAFLSFVFIFSLPSFADHVVGGDITVKWLNANNFEIKLQFFRDCNTAVPFDPTIHVGVFNKATNALQLDITMVNPVVSAVPLGDACYTPSTCLEKGVYTSTVTIPNNPNGYYISFHRCCRNAGITNIISPNAAGFIIYCEIPDPGLHNSSPTFNSLPDGYMCRNYPNTDSFTCTDVDGDQLVYSFSTPLDCSPPGVCSNNLAIPIGLWGASLPGAWPKPYGTISWAGGYSLANQMGDPAMAVNPTTGIVTTTPPNNGLYVFCVKVDEYRAGVKIGEIRRDFQFQVTNCSILNVQYNNTAICVGGSKTLTANGTPPAPFTYSWAPGGQTTSSIVVSPTTGGTYNYTVTTTKGACVSKAVASFVVNANPTASVTATGVLCLGQNTTLTASGGGTYSWSGGAGTAPSVAPTSNGTYTVTVTNAAGCTAKATGIVNNSPLLTSSLAVTNVACSGNPASAVITPSGGTGLATYTYAWSGGQTTTSVTGLTSGNYSVTVRDANNCSSQKTFSVNLTSTPSVTASSSTPAGCTVANGSATATVSGGTGPSTTYMWAPGGKTTQTATGLSAGVYTVTVTKSGCPKAATVTVTATANPSVTTTATNTGCTVANGTATAFPSGGTGSPAYTYFWSPSGQTTQTATGLFAGVYTILIRDANGCSDTETATITSATGPTATTTVNSHISCFGYSDGMATVNPVGGTLPLTYSWSNGQTSISATGLAAGTYVATVYDANGCVYSAAAIIIAGPTYSLTTTTNAQTNVSCFGGNDGVAIATPTGGTPGYTYLWAGIGQATQTATGLSSGSYTVNITDSKGCTTTNSVTIAQPVAALTSTISAQTNVSCYGGNDGNAIATASGGTSGYSYLWSGTGQSTQAITGLSIGTYTVNITDTLGCTTTNSVTISQPIAVLTSSIFPPTNVFCFGGNTGSATVSASGGTANYSYLWTNGQSAAITTGLSAGSYTVNITDAKGCTTIDSVRITQPVIGLNSIIFLLVNVSCFGGNDGYVSVNPTGGTPNYMYQWSNGRTTQTITGLSTGSYSVTITDAQGCTTTNSVIISQPVSVLTSSISAQTNVFCFGGNNGSATISASGGTANYSYAWTNGQSTAIITGLSAGSYTVTITDAQGCTMQNTVSIKQPSVGLTATTITQTNITCNGDSNATAIVNPTGGTPPYSYLWFNGTTTQNITGLSQGTYSVLVSDLNGCDTASSITITQPTPLLLSVSGNDSICPAEISVLNAISAGGTPGYSFSWAPGGETGTSISVSPSTSTTYSIIVTDANGCVSAQQTFNVIALPSPVALFDTTASGGSKFSSSFYFTDMSTGGINWYWDFGDGSNSILQNPTHTFPGTGIYPVMQIVYNQFGCPDTFRLDVEIAEKIIIPNVFTPDDNDMNDVFYIPNSGMREFHIQIFDRWGVLVFETTSSEIRWDGRTAAGKLLTNGTYFIVLDATYKNDMDGSKKIKYKGHVTLLTKK